MKKGFIVFLLLAFSGCSGHNNHNNLGDHQNSVNQSGNDKMAANIINTNKLSPPPSHSSARLLALLTGHLNVNAQDTGTRKMKKQRQQTYENNNLPPTIMPQKEIINDEPPGSPSGHTGNYSPANGLKPDTNATGTRVGNTYKSGNVRGEYQKVIKPSTDTSKLHQLH